MTIVPISPGSHAFSQVLSLWGKERTTLGLMPEGGFEDAARAGELLLAADPYGAGLGYVMFRRTRQRTATIVHLCVDPSHRGTGVARRLFEAVRSRCSDCFEIRVTCRRDFSANSLWHNLGFVALGEKPGRAKDSILTLWRYELKQLPILRVIESERCGFPGAVRAVIDANVFFDLDDDAPVRHESRALLVDWLDEFVEFAVTQELYNEVNRRANQGDRERQRARAARFVQVPRDAPREESVLSVIRQRLPISNAPSTAFPKFLPGSATRHLLPRTLAAPALVARIEV
jgi:GNAT superfamily N-acetyltransferase